jgi:hypothetical protein
MTNRNPASPYSQSSDLSKEIISRVSAHADRSLDRIFADIDNLLDGDDNPSPQQPPTGYPYTNDRRATPDPDAPVLPAAPLRSEIPTPDRSSGALNEPSPYSSPSGFRPSTPPEAQDYPQTQPQPRSKSSPRKKFLPVWSKLLLGIGITSVALSGGLLWLINERKIELPKNIDLSWVPFQSKSSISPDDAKFAEYMRKSIAKIDAANQSATSNNQATNSPSSSSAPFVNNSATGVITSTTPATIPVTLLNILAEGNRQGAAFEIEGKVQKVYVGEKIANSNWSLVTVAKGEVIVKKVSGEIRSIYLGQKF